MFFLFATIYARCARAAVYFHYRHDELFYADYATADCHAIAAPPRDAAAPAHDTPIRRHFLIFRRFYRVC